MWVYKHDAEASAKYLTSFMYTDKDVRSFRLNLRLPGGAADPTRRHLPSPTPPPRGTHRRRCRKHFDPEVNIRRNHSSLVPVITHPAAPLLLFIIYVMQTRDDRVSPSWSSEKKSDCLPFSYRCPRTIQEARVKPNPSIHWPENVPVNLLIPKLNLPNTKRTHTRLDFQCKFTRILTGVIAVTSSQFTGKKWPHRQ